MLVGELVLVVQLLEVLLVTQLVITLLVEAVAQLEVLIEVLELSNDELSKVDSVLIMTEPLVVASGAGAPVTAPFAAN